MAPAYSVGDCIEINNMRGDVIDKNLVGTTIMEIGPTHGSRQYTGRAIIRRFLKGFQFAEPAPGERTPTPKTA